MKTTKILVATCLAGISMIALSAFKGHETKTIKSTKTSTTGFAVIELFTSEGCSSCPPADELVSKIVKEDKDKAVYVLGYHVDYWNSLGWKDEFSKADYSQRQRKYAEYLRLSSVYTPQIVVNGKKEFVGSDEGALRGAIQSALQKQVNETVTISDVRFSNDALSLQFHALGSTDNRALLVAFVQKNALSRVKSGENGGRTLSHVNIVRDLNTMNLRQANGTDNVKLPAGFNPQAWEVISFVQNTATGEIISAQKVVAQGV